MIFRGVGVFALPDICLPNRLQSKVMPRVGELLQLCDPIAIAHVKYEQRISAKKVFVGRLKQSTLNCIPAS
jgi:hypothetical protein